MNSRAPICAFDKPSRASRATWASWAVSSLLVSMVRLRAVSPVAASSRRGRSANVLTPIASSMSWAVRSCSRAAGRTGARRLARVGRAALGAQPFPVEQVGAGELRADAGTAEPRDGLAVEPLGVLAVAEQGADLSLDP